MTHQNHQNPRFFEQLKNRILPFLLRRFMSQMHPINLIPETIVLFLLWKTIKISKLQYYLYNTRNRVYIRKDCFVYFLYSTQSFPINFLTNHLIEKVLKFSHQIWQNRPYKSTLQGNYFSTTSLSLKIKKPLGICWIFTD